MIILSVLKTLVPYIVCCSAVVSTLSIGAEQRDASLSVSICTCNGFVFVSVSFTTEYLFRLHEYFCPKSFSKCISLIVVKTHAFGWWRYFG